jgi:cytochrome c-type biogenesis protein CcmH/NrfG
MAAAPTFADWLARGRAHQWQGRPIDAIPCFERAARMEPRAGDAPFHLGEVRWQLGLVREAIGAWREAVHRAPDHLAPRLALAEALLFVGDDRGAHEAAGRSRSLRTIIGQR